METELTFHACHPFQKREAHSFIPEETILEHRMEHFPFPVEKRLTSEVVFSVNNKVLLFNDTKCILDLPSLL